MMSGRSNAYWRSQAAMDATDVPVAEMARFEMTPTGPRLSLFTCRFSLSILSAASTRSPHFNVEHLKHRPSIRL